MKLQDQIRYCDRCGISFLWSAEEQKRASEPALDPAPGNGAQSDEARPPAYCPGCRLLLPAPGRERGIVKWYNARKHYGFVTRQEGSDLFVHESALEPSARLYPGALVEFAVARDASRGPIAASVTLLESDPARADAEA